jgi:hopene-associated glycosyltransferase HpnB
MGMTALAWVAAGTLAFWTAVVLDRRRWWPPASASLRGEEDPDGRAAGALVAEDGAGTGLLVVVPARDEAEVLPLTFPSLLAQGGSFERLVIVDDASADGTADVARRLAAASASAAKVHVVTAAPVPPGWSGKLHALSSGIATAAAGGRCAPWILFTDADIEHPRGSLAALRARAAQGYDLVSVMARLRTVSFWERLLIPPFVHFFQLLYPFRRVADPRSRVAAAAGGCLLLRREALERAGGLEAMRDAVIDDVTLARRVKASGGRLWLGLDPGVLSARGYDGLAEITRMVSRTAFDQLGYRWSLLGATLLGLGLLFVAPPFLALLAAALGDPTAAAAALLAWGLESAHFLPALRHQRLGAAWALTLPLASLLYAYMTARSAWEHARGGNRWKGRRAG